MTRSKASRVPGMAQHPEHGAALAHLQEIGQDPRLADRIDQRDRLVDDQIMRPLQQRPRQAELLALDVGEALAGDADLIVEADAQHARRAA